MAQWRSVNEQAGDGRAEPERLDDERTLDERLTGEPTPADPAPGPVADPVVETTRSGRQLYGAEAELDQLLRCPNCGSRRVRSAMQSGKSYGFFGFKAITELGGGRDMECRKCGEIWHRPPLRELRREAQRRIDERYQRFEEENQRLLVELEKLRRAREAQAALEADGGIADLAEPDGPAC